MAGALWYPETWKHKGLGLMFPIKLDLSSCTKSYLALEKGGFAREAADFLRQLSDIEHMGSSPLCNWQDRSNRMAALAIFVLRCMKVLTARLKVDYMKAFITGTSKFFDFKERRTHLLYPTTYTASENFSLLLMLLISETLCKRFDSQN